MSTNFLPEEHQMELENRIKNLSLIHIQMCIRDRYHMDGLRVPRQNLFGVIARYEDGEKAMEDPVFYRMALELCKEI